ncbi:hypothetical protein Cni_G19332 [Canna indica]|uniref:Uncharacterized protein n=1 Tax=Canna indica TaxID=4628 RepID=A0AAQ3QIJ2_9LILI|nr:hypothetical protein Cni_G19332 [Canna indica]
MMADGMIWWEGVEGFSDPILHDTRTLSSDASPPPPPPLTEPSPSRPGLDGAHGSKIRAPASEWSQSWSWPEDESLEAQLLVDFQITVRVSS